MKYFAAVLMALELVPTGLTVFERKVGFMKDATTSVKPSQNQYMQR
jgi:hypothetical protein